MQTSSIASPGNLLETKIIAPYPRYTETETRIMETGDLYFNKPSRWFWRTWKLCCPLATCGFWAPEMWLVQIEIDFNVNYTMDFEDLIQKQNIKVTNYILN